MAAKATHNLVVKTGEYACARTGQTKGRWLNIGKVFKHDDGKTSIKLDALPLLNDWDGWVRVFSIEEQNGNLPPQAPYEPAYDQEPDEVPF